MRDEALTSAQHYVAVRRLSALVAAFAIFAVAPDVMAQSTRTPVPEAQPEARPVEVPPSETLWIYDLAEIQDRIRPGLPPDEELVAPDRQVPLPEAGELGVVVPQLSVVPPVAGDPGGVGLLGPEFALQGRIGAGDSGFIRSSIELQRAGSEPRFQLSVDHQMIDGFGSSVSAGSGFHVRSDGLSGAYQRAIGAVRLEADARFRRDEHGLQNRVSTFHAVSAQQLGGDAQIEIDVSESLSLAAAVSGQGDFRVLSGGAPSSTSRASGAAQASAAVELSPVDLHGSVDYSLQSASTAATFVHRVTAEVGAGYDLRFPLRLAGRVGLRYAVGDADVPLVVPFEVSVSGTPDDALSLRFAGGYEVVRHGLFDLSLAYPFIEAPQTTYDTRRLYADGSLSVNVGPSIRLRGSAKAEYAKRVASLATSVSSSGLYGIIQDSQPAFVLSPAVGLRWSVTRFATVSADWTGAFFDITPDRPPHSVSVVVRGEQPDGRYGFENTVEWEVADALRRSLLSTAVTTPVVSAGAFYRITDEIAASLEIRDFVQPLTSQERYRLAPFEAPGFRATVDVQIDL